jgi:TetR/AcrR family transcriptional repressor of nem operon
MTSKGERTRRRVIERAAPVFNQRGYRGSSLRDVMEATGLEKGGIYNHFRNKDELAVAAFEHNVDLIRQRIRAALAGRRHSVDRLRAILDVYRTFGVDPPYAGGCPLLNAAVDSDDTSPAMRERVRAAMDELRDGTLGRIVARGIERGELRPGTDADAVATVVVSGIEGALMLSHLYRDRTFVDQTIDHLAQYVTSLAEHQEGQS